MFGFVSGRSCWR